MKVKEGKMVAEDEVTTKARKIATIIGAVVVAMVTAVFYVIKIKISYIVVYDILMMVYLFVYEKNLPIEFHLKDEEQKNLNEESKDNNVET